MPRALIRLSHPIASARVRKSIAQINVQGIPNRMDFVSRELCSENLLEKSCVEPTEYLWADLL